MASSLRRRSVYLSASYRGLWGGSDAITNSLWPMYGRSANGPWQEGERLGNGGCISLTRNVVSMCACATVRVQGLLSYVWTSLHDSYATE